MKKWFKYSLTLGISIFLVVYLIKHREQLSVLKNIRPIHLIYVYMLLFLGTLNNSRITQLLIASFKVQMTFVEAVLLQNATRLLDLVPMKLGTLFRARYLKKRYRFSYSHSAGILIYRLLLTALTAGLVGLLGILMRIGDFTKPDTILAGFFLFFTLMSLFGMFVPLPLIRINSASGRVIEKLLCGRKQLSGNWLLTSMSVFHLFIIFILTSIRLAIIYKMAGHELSVSGSLIVGAVGFGAGILAITPEALGVREILLSSSSVLLGLPFEAGVIVSMFDRAMILVWTFVVGGSSLLWFRHKYPAEFKEIRTTGEIPSVIRES